MRLQRALFRVLTFGVAVAIAASAVPAVASAAERPPAPTVTSEQFPPSKEGLERGYLEQPGIFEITPPDGADVAYYNYSLNTSEQPVNRRIPPSEPDGRLLLHLTPTSVSSNTLYVYWVAASGGLPSEMAVYQFDVQSAFEPARAAWTFDARDGDVILDGSGNGHVLTPIGSPGAVPGRDPLAGGSAFDGDDGYTTGGPLKGTPKSFTLGAWARLDSRATGQTVLSLGDGVSLTYSAADDRWHYTLVDGAGAVHTIASAFAPVAGWTRLLATFDAATGAAELFVDGATQGTITVSGPDRGGPVHVGLGLVGRLDEIAVWDRVVIGSEWEIQRTQAELAGSWFPGHDGAERSVDRSDHGHDLIHGPGLAPDETGQFLEFDGSGCASAAGPVVPTDASFTVGAWARFPDKSADRDVIAQGDGFRIGYDHVRDRWHATMGSGSGAVRAESTTTAQLEAWVHLAATYDAGTRRLTLYVNGAQSATAINENPVNTGGPLTFGCSAAGTAWAGALAYPRVYYGALPVKATSDYVPSVRTLMEWGFEVPSPPSRRTPNGTIVPGSDAEGHLTLTTLRFHEWYGPEIVPLWTSAEPVALADVRVQPGDFNGDGYEDAALLRETVTTGADGTVTRDVDLTLLSGDEWSLTEASTVRLDSTTGDTGPWHPATTLLAAGDLDADRDEDLVALDARGCRAEPRVLLSSGTALATTPVTSPAGTVDSCLAGDARIALADMNSDGADELAVLATAESGTGARLTVHQALGGGRFAEPVTRWSGEDAGWNARHLTLLAGHVNGTADDPRRSGFADLTVVRELADGSWAAEVFTTVPSTTQVTGPVTWAVPGTAGPRAGAIPFLAGNASMSDDFELVRLDGSEPAWWHYANAGDHFGPESQVLPPPVE